MTGGPIAARRRAAAAATLALLAAGGCHRRVPDEAPPRAADAIRVAPQTSTIAVPITADLDALATTLEGAVPETLWTIDKPDQVCAAPTRVKLLFAKIRTPKVTCRITGRVTRGRLALSGRGKDIVVAMPIHAVVSASDIGGIIGRQTATADARVRALVRLKITPDWTPRATADIRYDWTDEPHVTLLGQRIAFTEKADEKLRDVIAKLERTLPQEIAKLRPREQAERAWKAGFTSIQLNEASPPVWMRITPRSASYGGYDIAGRTLTLRLGVAALTETFVGPRPADPAPTPLPPLRLGDGGEGRIRFAIPVVASYPELEPVLARALAKRAERPFAVPGIGPVTARFRRVVVYGTTGGRIAVGLTFDAATAGETPSSGTVWLTARPLSAPNSREVRFTDLAVSGVTDSTGTNLLIRLANAPGLSGTIAGALGQNFTRDYERLMARIATAIDRKRLGDVILRAHVTGIRTGALQATGQGVYLPVSGTGTASITLAPATGG